MGEASDSAGGSGRVRLGIPGFDPIFPNGIRAGSLIVIAGGPGTGKTLLAMQLLMEMHVTGTDPAPESLFVTADEPEDRLKAEMELILPACRVQYPRFVGGEGHPPDRVLKVPTIEAILSSVGEVQEAVPAALMGTGAGEAELLAGVRKSAVDVTLNRIFKMYTGRETTGPSQRQNPTTEKAYRAIALDGLLNLPELHGVSADARREALFQTATELRRWVRAMGHLAAIMTAELPTGHGGLSVHQLEDYMGDVVIHLGTEEPVKGNLRRIFHVVKARYVDAQIGLHSMYIMSPAEVLRRKRSNAALGWSDDTLRDLRQGVVVFSQLRWRSEPARGVLSPELESRLFKIRNLVAASEEGGERLEQQKLVTLISNVLLGRKLEPEDLKYLDQEIILPLIEILRQNETAMAELQGASAGGGAGDGSSPAAAEPSPDWSGLESWPDGNVKRLLGSIMAEDPNVQSIERVRSSIATSFAAARREFEAMANGAARVGALDALGQQITAIPDGMLLTAIRMMAQFTSALVRLMNPDRAGYCRIGIQGLDSMFAREVKRQGLVRGSSTAVIGGPGTGKSTIAYRFMQTGLVNGEHVIFLSFDERHRRILQQSGALTTPAREPAAENTSNTGAAAGTNTANTAEAAAAPGATAEAGANTGPEGMLAGIVARQLVRGNPAPNGRLCFAYEAPATADLNEIIHYIGREIPLMSEQTAHYRLIVDSLSDLQRNVRDPLVFNNFVATLLNKVADLNVTTLLVYEASSVGAGGGATAAGDDEVAAPGDLSHLADNIIRLRHVQVNNSNRKCLTVEKARGSRHDASVAELVFTNDGEDARVNVLVRKGFEGMSRVLTGNPQPAKIDLCLFHENSRERSCNKELLDSLRAKYGDRVRDVPFTLGSARRAYYHRQEGRDIRPDADVMVVSLDEPWVQLLSAPSPSGAPPLAQWDPAHASASQKWTVSQLDPGLRRYAECHEPRAAGEAAGQAVDPRLRPMHAIPHYFDVGMLLRNEGVAGRTPIPTHWENVGNGQADARSFQTIVDKIHRVQDCPGFAFNMDSVETTACVLIEFCWNFFADQGFLCTGGEWNQEAVGRALQFLADLRWSGALPFPCGYQQCARAAYTRSWYANVPTLSEAAPRPPRLRPVAFPTSCLIGLPARARPKDVPDLRARLKGQLAARIKRVAQDAAALDAVSVTASAESYRDHLLLQRRRASARNELDRLKGGLKLLVDKGQPRGWSCSGAWYLGVISDGGNAQLGWSLVEEALDARRVEQRARRGGGLPPAPDFYRDHDALAVPFLHKMSFGKLADEFFGAARPRESVLGISLDGHVSAPALLATCRELPELLHSLVMNVLRDPQSKRPARESSLGGPTPMVRGEVKRLFEQIAAAHE